MPPPSLTKEEQKTLDQLKAVCAKQGPKATHVQQSCAILRQQQALEERLDRVERESKARDQLAEQRRQALAYVTRTVNQLQTEGTLLLGALLQASGQYDIILAARAAKSVAYDILADLAIAALPELKLLGRVVGRWTSRYKQVHQAVEQGALSYWDNMLGITGIHQFEFEVKAARNAARAAKVQSFADSLDKRSKDIINAIKDPFASNAAIDAESHKRFVAFQAKNQVLSEVITAIQRRLIAANFFEAVYHKFIDWYQGPDLLMKVQMGFSGGPILENPASFDTLAELILYDMLRAYVRYYFAVHVAGDRSIDSLPNSYWEGNIEGLDSAQRKVIYGKFGNVPWKDATRPPVNSYKDLLKYWGGRVIRDYHDPDDRGEEFPQAF